MHASISSAKYYILEDDDIQKRVFRPWEFLGKLYILFFYTSRLNLVNYYV